MMNIDDLEGLDDEISKKIEELQKVIRKDDSDENFSLAQRKLAEIYYNYGFLDDAVRVSKLIKLQDSKEHYEKAQYNIGAAYDEQGNTSEALKVWSKIEKGDFPGIYARAQYNTGVILSDEGRFEEAKTAWKNVKQEDYPEAYAKAQSNMASLFLKEGKEEDANQAWDNVEKNDYPEAYARAQFNLGVRSNLKGDTNDALGIWEAIEVEDSLEIYNSAQYNICTVLMEDTKYHNIDKAKQALEKIINEYKYEKYCLTEVLKLVECASTKDIGNSLLLLFIYVSKIIEIIRVDFSHRVTDNKPVERKLAHYTGTYITNLLLETDSKNSLPSSFRLNTINNVNDPSEGHLLMNHLNGSKESYFRAPDFDGKLHAFISCFTFNHDSLNQFRLYGKEGNKEASGVSLVFKKEFFKSNNFLGGLSFLSTGNSIQNLKKVVPVQRSDELSVVNQSSERKLRVGKQQVMRCVYIDPTSNYIQLAQRNRLTFFREFIDEVIEVEGEKISKAEHEWNQYKKYIDEKTESFNDTFISLKNTYKLIIEEKIRIKKDNLGFSDDIEVLLYEILLPLKYLIKHSAFQEEQECRMIYITSLDKPEVQMEFGKFLYVEYGADVKEHLDKIYIAPAATQYQPYLAKLLCDSDVRIDLSNNPYRQI